MCSTMTLYFVRGIICLLATVSYASPVRNEDSAAKFLQKFGYLENYMPGAMVEHKVISSAIKDFQRFAGLSETGALNSETISMMNAPRCGVKDVIAHSESGRKKRFILEGTKWPLNGVTYRINKFPSRIPHAEKVRRVFARAFKMWSDITALTFREESMGQVDIDISFNSGDHGDASPFDGPGKTLAHAFFPRDGGDVHFDDEEMWTIDEKTGTTLLQVAAHEFGHSLGLSHTDVTAAIMAPSYKGYNPAFKPHEDDIKAIQTLYGPHPGNAPDLCRDASLDTVTRTLDGSTYVFKGDWYWKVIYNVTAAGYPRRISDDWGGLEGNLDASFTGTDGKTFFFKGGRYWSFTNQRMDSGYPKLISEGYKGIPDNLDAALAWSGNGKPYFFKGNEYWRYDKGGNPPVDAMYPMSIREWKGLPVDGVDAAFVWENERSYFFKGGQYYRFDDSTDAVAKLNPPYPYPTAVWWFSCRR